jgi:hypothetical protein
MMMSPCLGSQRKLAGLIYAVKVRDEVDEVAGKFL